MYSNRLTRFFLSEFKKQTLVTKAKTKFLLYYILLLIPLLCIFTVISYLNGENLLLSQNVLCVSLFIISLIYLKLGKLDIVINIGLVFIGFIFQLVLLIRNLLDNQFVTLGSFGFDLVFLVSIIIVIVASFVSTKFYQIVIIDIYTLLLIISNLSMHNANDLAYHIAIIAITFLCLIFSFIIHYVIRRFDIVLRQRKSLNQLLKYKVIQEQKLNFDAESASRAKSEFLTNISHEFLTPMNAVVGLTDALLKKEKEETKREYLGQIKKESGKLLILIDEIIDFSKINKGDFSIKMRDFSIKDEIFAISEGFSDLAREKGLKLEISIGSEVPDIITADQKRVNQVISYLMDNAIKFTEKGYIKVSCYLKLIEYIGYIQVSIEDTGIGISSQKLNKLFHTFTQLDGSLSRRYGGLGLGLVKAHTLAKLMGGNLEVESFENKGSTFTLFIPLKSLYIYDGNS